MRIHENQIFGDERSDGLSDQEVRDALKADGIDVTEAIRKAYEDALDKINTLEAKVAALKEENARLKGKKEFTPGKLREAVEAFSIAWEDAIDHVAAQVQQECSMPDGLLDSMAVSARANALEFLAEQGRVRIIERQGRRIIAEWTKAAKTE